MGAIETKTFMSGNSEAVRLPKEFAFGPGTPVTIERTGDTLTIRPLVEDDPEKIRRQLQQLFDDMDAIGRPNEVQQREPFEWPDRPGL